MGAAVSYVPESWQICREGGIYRRRPPFYHLLVVRRWLCNMQIEKNIAATLQRKMNAAGKTKLEF